VPALRVALIAAGGLAVAAVAVLWPALGPARHLLFTGDILLSRQVAVEMHATHASPFDSVAPLFARADWVAGNLEGAIGSARRCGGPDSTCFAFPDTTPLLLARAGFKAVSVENNHAADLGADGRARTRAALRSAGLLALDFDHSPRFVRLGDVTMAVIAVSLVRGADGEAQTVPSVALAQKLRLARALANLVVVSIHWGTELQDWPSPAQHAAAEWLVDQGADLVIGHHPHVVQRPDCVHGRPVFFSLGNHVFDQRYPETRNGLIADCAIQRGRLRCGGVNTHARHGSATPVATGTVAPGALAACDVSLGSSLVVSGYTLRPRPWSPAGGDDGVAIEGWQDGALRWTSPDVALVSLQAGLAVSGRESLLLALERHPSPMDGEVAIRPHVYGVGDHGLVARWRGTALAWPLIDAVVNQRGELCALHRGDAFVRPDPLVTSTRTMLYAWNGFGFSAADDGAESARCAAAMRALAGAAP
jgi:hypothetical protein